MSVTRPRRWSCSATGGPPGTPRAAPRATPTSPSTTSATPRRRPRPPLLAALAPVRAVVQRPRPRPRRPRRTSREATGLSRADDPRLREYDVGERAGPDQRRSSPRASPSEYAAWLAAATSDAGRPGAETDRRRSATRMRAGADASCLAALGAGGDRHRGRATAPASGSALLALLGWPPGRRRDACAAWTTAAGPCSASTTVRTGLRLAAYNQTAQRARPAPDFASDEARWLRFRELPGRTVGRRSWGCGAAGSAPAWHAGGQGFESPQLHRGRRVSSGRREAAFAAGRTESPPQRETGTPWPMQPPRSSGIPLEVHEAGVPAGRHPFWLAR